jgi:protein TonB
LHLVVLLTVIGLGLVWHRSSGADDHGFAIELVSVPDVPEAEVPTSPEKSSNKVSRPSPLPAKQASPRERHRPKATKLPETGTAGIPTEPTIEPDDDTPSNTAPASAAAPAGSAIPLATLGERAASPKFFGDNYLDVLQRWLTAHISSIQSGLGRDDGGWVKVSFTVLRDGTIVDAQVIQSSGFATVDAASLELLRQASPAPPLPDAIAGTSLAVTDAVHIWALPRP